MNRQHSIIVIVLAVVLVSGLSVAGGNSQSYPTDSTSIGPSAGDTIAVLSVADVRKDKSVGFKKLNTIGHRTVKTGLKKSRYELAFQSDFGGIAAVTDEDLEYLDPSWVSDLGPDGERWVLLVVLEDAARKATFGSAFGTVCSGYLFDRSTGEAVWLDEATGTQGQGGLIGFAMGSAMRGEAFASCTSNLLASFPGRNHGKKKKQK